MSAPEAAALSALDGEQRARLPLFGVPVAIKDNFDTADLPTAYGSPIYAGHRPEADAAAVARLRAAGALIAGKTKCAEFAWMTPSDTLNPLDRSRTPGGSSNGSAAAVAAGAVPLATGTQTAGSINRPGSYCGVLGFKPTFGRYDRDGVKPMSGRSTRSACSPGASATSAWRGIRLVLGGPDARATSSGGPALGLARAPTAWAEVEPAAPAAIEDSRSAAWDAGACLGILSCPATRSSPPRRR